PAPAGLLGRRDANLSSSSEQLGTVTRCPDNITAGADARAARAEKPDARYPGLSAAGRGRICLESLGRLAGGGGVALAAGELWPADAGATLSGAGLRWKYPRGRRLRLGAADRPAAAGLRRLAAGQCGAVALQPLGPAFRGATGTDDRRQY